MPGATSPRLRSRLVSLGLAVIVSLALFGVPGVAAQAADPPLPEIELLSDDSGVRLQVDGEDFMVLGINWDYFPRGTTYNYNFWTEPDDLIKAALDREMGLARAMGVNAIRAYVGITPEWVEYIWENYGIWTVLNHALGRYGVTVNGVFEANTNYADPESRAVVLAEVEDMVEAFKDTPGVLMWLLGNENNYGLFWSSAETEDMPEGERDIGRARYLYSLVGDATELIKELDPTRPVAYANGDLQYIDLIAEEAGNLDVIGSNVYRGRSFNDFFEEVDEKLGMAVLFTEFGADVWNARSMREDQLMQTRFLLDQWQEIYEESAGKGGVGNSIGGLTFQWTDGWWKFGQEDNLDVQDTNASWANNAYPDDYVPGQNNMNEEWWGIVAKGPTDNEGLYELFPRAAFYALRDVYELDPYGSGTTMETIGEHFASIMPEAAELEARGDRAAFTSSILDRFQVSSLRAEFETFSTGGSVISTPGAAPTVSRGRPSFRGFDQLQSFYGGITARPAGGIEGEVIVNVLGAVPNNPIDEIFYENRGRPRTVQADGEQFVVSDLERLKVYQANLSWDDSWFRLNGFYRTGHYHWGYEGDFFGLYREANYGPNIDIYNGGAPLGVEIDGKRLFNGLSVAFGPELWWGANPAILGKLTKSVGPFQTTVVYQEDLAEQGAVASSFAVPLPPTRKATVHVAATRGDAIFEVGGIWSGSTKEGEAFQIVRGAPGGYEVLGDEIEAKDALGAKAKVTLTKGRWNWYVQGAAMGLVAEGGPTATQTFTGWWLRDSGMGNQYNLLTGVALNAGNWQIAPNFLWQSPIVGPIPDDAPAPARPRNVVDDPFAVRGWNRETKAMEFLLTYDPTPATWMHSWDSDMREDAAFAATVGFTYKSFGTTQDAGIGILADGRSIFAFPGAPPARDVWELKARLVSKRSASSGFIANVYTGTGEPNGDSPRLIRRHGLDLRVISGGLKLETFARVNDWGPYDYHRDFNHTFPFQLMGDLSYSLGRPAWFDLPGTRLGVRATWRSLDMNSPRYCPAPTVDADGFAMCEPGRSGADGSEWEIRTYVHIAM